MHARWSRRIIVNTIFIIQVFFFFILATQCAVYATGQLAAECMVLHVFGYFQKKSKQTEGGGCVASIYIYPLKLRIYFFENPPGIFHFFTLPLEILDKTKLNPWIFHKIVLDPLEIPRPKNKDPWKFHIYFLVTLGNSTSFLINPWKSQIFENPGIFHFFYFTSGNSRQNKAQPLAGWIFHKIVLDPLEIPRPKTKTPGNSTHIIYFLVTLGNSTLFLINHWKFHMLFL